MRRLKKYPGPKTTGPEIRIIPKKIRISFLNSDLLIVKIPRKFCPSLLKRKNNRAILTIFVSVAVSSQYFSEDSHDCKTTAMSA